ncbi:MAG: methyltransferase, TIGR04325 family [Pirellulales bacterium]
MLKRLVKRWRHDAGGSHYEYVPEGWARETTDSLVKGWNVATVVDTQLARLDAWRESFAGTAPLGVTNANRAASTGDLVTHNTAVTFAYVVALAARKKDRLSLLDWGGGVGQYCFAAEAAVPGVAIDYHCKEVPVQCNHGRRVLPNATFYTDDDQFAGRRFDLVFASGSLHYAQDWQTVLARLAAATGEYLFVTRLPVVFDAESFVYLQRAYAHGYDTEYLGWALNRSEFLAAAESQGLQLVREFLVSESAHIAGAPEDCQSRGFLFERTQRGVSPTPDPRSPTPVP